MTYFRKSTIRLIRNWRKFWVTEKFKTQKFHYKAVSIFRLALRDSSSKLNYMPIQEKRLISLDHEGLFIILEKNIIEITNHKFNYRLELSSSLYNKIIKEFDLNMDKRVQGEEKIRLGQLEMGLDALIKVMTK